jgi:hypothetical protein
MSNVPDYYPPGYFTIAPGDTLYLEVVYVGNNQWANYIYWGPYGGWTLFSQYQLDHAVAVDTNVVNEAYTGYTGPRLVLPQTWVALAQIYWCNPSCGWYLWDMSVSGTSAFADYPPYYLGMDAPYYYWSGQGGP